MDKPQSSLAKDRPPASYRYSSNLPTYSAILSDVLKTGELNQLFESYYNLIHIPVAIIDLEANVLFSSRWQRICVDFHRVHPETCRRCIESDTKIAQQLTEGRKCAIYKCRNGLTDCASPIIIDGQHVANVFVGQFLTEKPDAKSFRRTAEEFGFNVGDYLEALYDVPVVEEERIPAILDLLMKMTRVVTSLSVDRSHAIEDQARQKVILDSIPQGVFWKDTEGKYLGCNAAFARVAGFSSPDQVAGKTDFDLPWSRAEVDAYRADDQQVIASKKAKLHIIESIHQSDGSLIIADTSKIPLIHPSGHLQGIVGIFDDVTERVQREARQRESDERFRVAFETGRAARVIVGRDDGRILEVNRRMIELYGYSREEMVGRTSMELGMWVFPEAREAMVAELSKTGYVQNLEVLARRKNGEQFYVSYSTTQLTTKGKPLVLGVINDITESKRASEELRASEIRFQTLIDNAPLAVGVSRNTRTIYANRKYRELFRIPDGGDLTGSSIFDSWPLEQQEYVRDISRRRAQGEMMPTEYQGVARRADGELFPIQVSVTVVQLPDGPAAVAFFVDLTKIKKTEEALRQAEELYRGIFEGAAEGIFRTSRSGQLLTANLTLARILGYDSPAQMMAEVSNVALQLWANPDERTELVRQLETQEQPARLECQLRRRDGALIWALMSVRRVTGPDGRTLCYEGFITDITEKKNLEEQFLRAQRLESIGMLAAGIAHDLNNALAPIRMAVPLLCRNRTDAGELRILKALESSGERGAHLVRQILGFAQGVSGAPQLVQMKHLLRDISEMVNQTFPKSVVLDECIPKDLWPVMANPTQIHQILLNLCVNARDAMPAGGTLRLAAENRVLSAGMAAAIAGARPGAWVVLHVEDTGTGIAPDVLALIWEPFFTTKGVGRGTGLGLPTVRGIVETHGGFITVETEVGRGTAFHVYLPAEETSQAATATVQSTTTANGHGETILFADDEPTIREMVEMTLTSAGYVVESAEDGARGIEIFQSRPDAFALVVTDVDMPLVDGPTFARCVRAIRPRTKILVVSGIESRTEELKWQDFSDDLLPKPFSAEGLVTAVHRLITLRSVAKPADPLA